MKSKSKDMSPSPMRDRFKGRTNLSTAGVARQARNWDDGLKPMQGAGVAPYPGTVKNQKSDAKFNNSNTGLGRSSGLGGSKGTTVPRPATAGPTYPGVKGGHGPKPGSHATGRPTQMGGSPGPDKSPKPMKNRFAGKTHGK